MENPLWTTFGVLEASGVILIGIGYFRARATYSFGGGNSQKVLLTFDF
ncbi:MAG TPA: hypothetical protein VLX68_04355 [Chitinivibrionales bacterium]|nr:hypothetical protein [Chitinivibrionales bacterium]